MHFDGIVQPEQLAVITAALEAVCRRADIEPGTPEHEEAARLVMSLYIVGASSADELGTAAASEWDRRKSAGPYLARAV